MHPQVIRDAPGQCPICGMELTPLRRDTTAAAPAERRILYYWDPMLSPPYISDRPGKSPMGMDLIAVYQDEVSAGATVTIDPTIVQNMGVRVAPVVEGPLRRTVRAVGYLEEPDPAHFDINLRVSGWIQKLYANVDGMHLDAGDPLFDLYSPELQVAIGELIAARRARPADGGHGAATLFYETARQKLELLGLTRAQVERLAMLDRPPATVTFTSPITAHLTEKLVYEGDAVKAGDKVLRLADRTSMWLDARVFEQDLGLVAVGHPARATVSALPGRAFDGAISFIHPHLDPVTRTGMARMVLPNDGMVLRQGMYATVEIEAELAPRALLVPREAVIDTGSEQVAFVAQPGGHFDPRRVRMGASGDDGSVQILAGLAPGEQVVTSGQFLIDAESRFREAIQRYLKKDLLEPGAAAPPPHVH
ncbi:MAG: efflux RND transporter periplasmic adaptor subunit [Candidatus Binatia bacterium]